MSECTNCDGSGQVPKEWNELEFEDYLNDVYDEVNICGLKYSAGTALKEIDPIAFNCAMNDCEQEEECPDCDGSGEIEDEEEAV